MSRYHRHKGLKSVRPIVFLVLAAVLLGGLGYFGRQVPPPHQQVVKTLDSARFAK